MGIVNHVLGSEQANTASAVPGGIQAGNRCLINVTGRHFLVEILDVGPDTIRVSFPGADYPIEGMRADIEFHDEAGFYYYSTEVLKGPTPQADGIVLLRPSQLRRSVHRSCCRVSTDLMVRAKDQVHVRRYDAVLVNISTGGALILTEAPFDFSTTVELTLSLPGEPSHTVLGQVVHVVDAPDNARGKQVFGIRFNDLEPEIELSLNRYIWRRLQEIYPQD